MDVANDIRDLTIQVNAIIRTISRKYNITLSQSNILMSIPYGGVSIVNLSAHVGVDISTMSRNLTKLSHQNLIIKERSAFDLREYNIYLTDAGSDILLDINRDFVHYLSNNEIDIVSNNDFSNAIESINWSILKLRNNK